MDGNTDSAARTNASAEPAKTLNLEAPDGGSLVLPEGLSLTSAEFAQNGSDLVLSFPDGTQVVVEGFFNQPNPPKLVSADGAQVPGEVASQLAAPETRVAQGVDADAVSAGTDGALPGFAPQPLAEGDSIVGRAVAGTDGSPIGQVQNMSGSVVAVRADGTRVTLEVGAPVYQGDILETTDDGSVGIILADQTTFSMGENGRMVLDEMIYDPSTQQGSVSMSVLQGVFTFVSGQVAKTDPDAMTLNTPVATIGIRGTQVGLEIPDGKSLNVVLMREADGFVGEVVVYNAGGTRVMNGANDFTAVKSFDTVASAVTKIQEGKLVDSFASALRHLPLVSGSQNDFGLQQKQPPQQKGDLENIANFQTAAGGQEQAPPAQETVKVVEGDYTKAAETVETVKVEAFVAPIVVEAPRQQEVVQQVIIPIDTGPKFPPPPAGVAGVFSVRSDGRLVLTGSVAGNVFAADKTYDMVLTGSNASNTIVTGSGDDTIFAGGGDDLVIGGAGNDTIIGGEGNDILVGGAGLDASVLGGFVGNYKVTVDTSGNISIQSPDGTITITSPDGDVTIIGPDGTAVGTVDNEVAAALDTNFLSGGLGDDIIIGGAGVDTLEGDAGNDVIIGGSGKDTLIGGEGNDILAGGAGDDVIDGGAGSDVLFGGTGDDTLIGGAGDDRLFGGTGNDILVGGAGDSLVGGDGDDLAVFAGNVGDFTISVNATGDVTISDANGTTVLQGIENVQFADGTFAIDDLLGPDTPVLGVPSIPVMVNEDTAVPLNITVTDPNQATPEILSVTISGIPDGALLRSGDTAIAVTGGTATLTPAQLSGLTVTPPANSNQDFQLTVTATAVNATGATVTSEPKTLTVDAIGVADAPTLTASVGPGQVAGSGEGEVGSITLSVAKGGWGNTGEFEVFVNGQSVGVFTTDIAHEASGQWQSITISGLSLTPGEEPVISIQPTSPESHVLVNSIEVNGHLLQAETDGALQSVTGNPDQSAGVVHDTYIKLNPNGSLNFTLNDDVFDDVTGTIFPLNINTALTDTDGSETLSITVGGLPEGATLSAGTQNPDGTWTLSTTQLANLTMFVPGDMDQTFNLTVSATATENDGDTETVSVSVAVGAEDVIADDPTLAVSDTTGSEDTAIPLDVRAALTDTDGSETLSITIAGVPDGAVLSAGTRNADGTWTLGGEQLEGLTITPAPNSSTDFTLTVTATATNLASGDTATVTGTLNVDVTAVADLPTLNLTNAVGVENDLIKLNISAAVTDPSETLAVSISGIPEGATLYVGRDADGNPIPVPVQQPGGIANVDPAQLDNVFVLPAPNSDANFDLTVTATSTDEGSVATTSGSLSIDVLGVPDTPTLQVQDARGFEDNAIPLGISAALTDTDGSETLSITIAGVPQDATLSAGTRNADGTWTLTAEQLDGLSVTPAPNSNQDFTLTVTAVSSENGETATTVGSLAVDVVGVADAPTLSASLGEGTPVGGGGGSGSGSGHGRGHDEHGQGLGLGHVKGHGSGSGGGIAGTEYPLNIDTALTDTDGSETLSITVGGLPAGVELSAGTHNPDGTWTLTSAQLQGLTMFVPSTVSVDFSITVTSTATENDGDTESTSTVIQLGLDTTAETPTLTVSNAQGAEDNAIPLNIGAALVDTDGSETLSITLGGIPEGAVLKSGDIIIAVTDGSASLTPAQLQGLTITPPANSNEDFQLTVTATSTESQGGATATTTGVIDVDVTGVADAPTVNAEAASGLEDTAIPLNIAVGGSADTDGSETLSITLGGIPEGAVLRSGDTVITVTDGSAALTPAQLTGLTITPPLNSDADFALTVTATTTENDGSTASVSGEIPVSVAPDADVPTLNLGDPARGSEDTAIPLDIQTAVADMSEVLSITITGIPEGAVLKSGDMAIAVTNGSVTLTPAQLAGLNITPPANSDADFPLSVTVTSQDGDSTAQASGTLNVIVDAVADAPTLALQPASGNEDMAIPLDVRSALTDTDGSETLSITIGGVPNGATLSAGTPNADGSWTLTPTQLTGLTITPPANSNQDFQLTVTATSTDGASTATTTATLNVDVVGVADAPTLSVSLGAGVHVGGGAGEPDPGHSGGSRSGSRSGHGGGSGSGHGSGEGVHYEVGNGDASVTLENLGGEAGYKNTYGYYVKDENGNPAEGRILWDNVKGDRGDTVTLEGVDPDRIGFFLIPNGDKLNRGADDGDEITFRQDSNGNWIAVDDHGRDLKGEGARLLFDEPSLNRGGLDYMVDNASAGNQNWEDLVGLGDRDFNDVNVNVTWHDDQPGATVYPLDISTGLTDTDQSETLSITVAGIPEGATLSAGTHNADGTWTLTPAQLQGLTLTVPDGSPGFSLSVTATATENDGDTEAVSQAVTVPGSGEPPADTTAETPTLTAHDAAGAEDTAIPLDLSAALADTDGSESLSITVSGIPEGAVLKSGDTVIPVTGGSATLTSAQLDNLTLTPPANSNVDIDLTVSATATESNGGDTATATDNLHIDVTGVADAPDVTVRNETGSEDRWIQLHLDADLTDADGSETLSITIAGVPAGAILSPGQQNDDGTWTVTAAELPQCCILPPEDFSGEIPLTLTVTSTENDGDTETVSKDFTVSVAGVADAPTLVVANASGSEDSAIPLNINAALTDASETLSVTIENIPSGAVLKSGDTVIAVSNGAATLTPAQLSGLTITPPANWSGEFQLGVTATSRDGAASAAAVSALIAVAVAGVADAPTVDATLGAPQVRTFDLDISGALTDTDGSESLSFLVSGLPQGATLSAGTDNGDGTWSLTPVQLDGLQLTVSDEIVGGFDLTVQAISMEDDGSTATSAVAIHVEAPDVAGVTLTGGSGRDTLTGGQGDDLISGGSGNDRLLGQEGADTIYGGSGKDTILGGSGHDSLYGESGDDTIYGGTGNDLVDGGAGDDKLYGEAGDDVMYGGSGDDTVDGGAGHDTVYGDDGKDVMFGGAGDDTLHGGAGNDVLSGGAGKDTFVFDADSGLDIITDIMEQDKLVFEGQEFNAQDLVFSKDQDSGDVVVSFAGVEGKQVKLEGVKYDTFVQNDNDGDRGYSVHQDDGKVTVNIEHLNNNG